MAHDATLREKAKEMFVVNGFSMDTISDMMPEVARKTLYNWRNQDNWESLRRERVAKTSNRRERLERALDQALDELEVRFDPKLVFSIGKLVAALKSTSTFEFTEEKRDKEEGKKRGLTPETLKDIEHKLLGL